MRRVRRWRDRIRFLLSPPSRRPGWERVSMQPDNANPVRSIVVLFQRTK